MVILQIVDIRITNANGVAEAVKKYVKYESLNNEVAIYNLDTNLKIKDIKEYNVSDFKSINDLPKPFNKPDIVIFNEIYKMNYIKLSKYCIDNKIPYIIIPHGCLVDVAQKHKIIKKKLANMLFFNKFIKKASAIQFLNVDERDNTHFKYNKYIISGNGTDYFVNNINLEPNNSTIYVGRYAIYHKGLDLIINVCEKYKDWFLKNKIIIDLYGRNTYNDEEELKNMVKDKCLEEIIHINSGIYGDDKIDKIKKSYCFIQTSRHEGQPMGIIESLALGVPCIVTKGTTFSEYVNDNNCGIGINFDIEELYSAISKIYEDKKIRNVYAENSLKCSIRDFEWKNIIDNTIKEYLDIINTERKEK